ncbi:MAG: hypothetical protein WBA77_09805 [Microcoleaceae cyanobacterium]
MNQLINSILNRLSPMHKKNIYIADQTVEKKAYNVCKPSVDIIHNSNSEISENPQTFGFALEELIAIGFNLNTELNDAEAQCEQVSVDKTTKYQNDIYINTIGKIITEIQAKASFKDCAKPQINSENYNLSSAEIIIDIDSIKSFTINQEFAQWVAENPYLAANLMCTAATLGEHRGARIQRSMINATSHILLQSIKPLVAYCQNEKGMDQAELYNLLQLSVDSLKQDFIRETAIRVIQNLRKSKAFTTLGFTVKSSVIPVLVIVMQDEITIQKGISIVGIKAFTSGIVTTIVLLFPSVGLALLSRSVIQTIWEEITPQWQKFISNTTKTTVNSTQQGIVADDPNLQQETRKLYPITKTYSTEI